MLYISPALFSALFLTPFVCAYAAQLVVKSSAGKCIYPLREIKKWLFIVYISIVAALSFCPVSYDMSLEPVYTAQSVNLIPFKNFLLLIGVMCENGLSFARRLHIAGQNFLSGFFLFIPYGFMIPCLNKKFNKFSGIFLFSVLLSLLIETVQYAEKSFGFSGSVSVSVDDMLSEIIGALLGLFLWRLFILPKSKRQSRRFKRKNA